MLFTGCASLYPIGGAIVGGAAGSLAGPAGAALGAGAGATGGQMLAKDKDLKEAQATIQALTTGDVQKLIELQAGKEQSGFDAVIDGIYRVLWLLGVGMVLWFVIPWIWAKSHVKKAVAKHINGHGK
jgi:hypothetical protein